MRVLLAVLVAVLSAAVGEAVVVIASFGHGPAWLYVVGPVALAAWVGVWAFWASADVGDAVTHARYRRRFAAIDRAGDVLALWLLCALITVGIAAVLPLKGAADPIAATVAVALALVVAVAVQHRFGDREPSCTQSTS